MYVCLLRSVLIKINKIETYKSILFVALVFFYPILKMRKKN